MNVFRGGRCPVVLPQVPCCPAALCSLTQTVRRVQGAGGLSPFLALFLWMSLSSARAQDARAIMNKMDAAYQHADSYIGRANVDDSIIYNGAPIRSENVAVEIKARRPNKLFLNFSTRRGSRQVFSDGFNFTVYDPSPNRFSTVRTAPTFAALMPILQLQAEVVATYDPLYFLSHGSIPPEIGALQVSNGTYDGQPVYRVTGVVHEAARQSLSATGSIVKEPARNNNWTWWIDKKTYLLHKIEMTAAGKKMNASEVRAKTTANKIISVTVFLRHTVVSAGTTPAPADDAFVFHPPSSAQERQPRTAILNRKK